MSKRLLFIISVLLFVSAGAFAQVGGYSSTATDTTGKRLSLPTVKVCADALCSTPVTIYKDAAQTALANPFTGDSQGNYSFYAAPGNYFAQVAKAGYATLTIPFSIGGDSSQAGNNAFTGTNTFTGNNAHSGAETFTGNTAADTSAPFAGTYRALSAGVSTAIQVICDSTCNESTEWPYLFALNRAAEFPNYTVNYYLWNDTTQAYNAPVVLQTGAGGTRYANFTGSVNGMRLESEAFAVPTGDQDIRFQIAPTTWRPAANLQVMDKFTSPYRAMRLYLKPGGTLTFEWSNDGTTVITTNSTAAVPDLGANVTGWVRATFQPGTSTVTFYTSTDGATWTQLGTPVATSAGSVFTGSDGIINAHIDDWNIGTSFTGNIYKVEIRNGINGPIVNPQNIDAWQILDTATFVGAPVLNFINGSQPGADIPYWTDATRKTLATPNFQQTAAIVSISHNELRNTGAGEMQNYGNLFLQVKGYLNLAHLVVLTQNPRTTPASNITEQAIRRAQLMSNTSSPVGYDVIDTYGAFVNDPRFATSPGTLVNPVDGIHPCNGGTICPGNNAGEALMESTIENAWKRSKNAQSPVYSTAFTNLPVPVTQGGTGTTTNTGTGSVVLSNSPSIDNLLVTTKVATPLVQSGNASDTNVTPYICQSGLTIQRDCYFSFRSFSGTERYKVGMSFDDLFKVLDAAGLERLLLTQTGETRMRLPAGAFFDVRNSANAIIARVDESTGKATFNGGVAPSSTGNVTWTSGAGAPAAGNCTTAKGGSLFSRTDGTTTTTLYVCDGSTGVWTAK